MEPKDFEAPTLKYVLKYEALKREQSGLKIQKTKRRKSQSRVLQTLNIIVYCGKCSGQNILVPIHCELVVLFIQA